ncbi:c-type cytochrome [Exilibacterium tricleocarpae]|uniref:c-type cytochrome n=1 Tax=Exilibacterium tricleocarpae TaxID=2591008 RepID=UPI001FE5D10D|nr:c-type cytochrome [Exilibacterium tricleocarpae]
MKMIVLICGLGPATGWAQKEAPGVEQVFATCAVCHGQRAEGKRALQAPGLTALSAAYIARQLRNFAAGTRGAHPEDTHGAQMAAAVSQLGEGPVLERLATYIAALPAVTPEATVSGDLKRGKDFYSMVCGSCHGPAAEGNVKLQAPALAGTDDWYLVRQLEHFRAGIRGGEGADALDVQMRSMAQILPDTAAVHNVVAYIQSLVVSP